MVTNFISETSVCGICLQTITSPDNVQTKIKLSLGTLTILRVHGTLILKFP